MNRATFRTIKTLFQKRMVAAGHQLILAIAESYITVHITTTRLCRLTSCQGLQYGGGC